MNAQATDLRGIAGAALTPQHMIIIMGINRSAQQKTGRLIRFALPPTMMMPVTMPTDFGRRTFEPSWTAVTLAGFANDSAGAARSPVTPIDGESRWLSSSMAA